MSVIIKQDTDGTKGTLAKGELGYDDYTDGGDIGRVYVGDGADNIPLSKKSELDTHSDDADNPHTVTQSQVGLSEVDNTSDAAKPVSNDTQVALDLKAVKAQTSDTTTVYDDANTDSNYKLYISDGDIVLEEI